MLSKQINVRIAQEDYDRLIKLAESFDRKPAYIVRRAIIDYLNGIAEVSA